MPDQQSLFSDDIYEALRTCISAMGGAKRVGKLLWPELTPPRAGERLACCLNPDRGEKLDLDQVLLVLREARVAGCHAGLYFIADECGYERPRPTDPEDQIAELQDEINTTAERLESLVSRFEKVAERTQQMRRGRRR